MSLDPYRPPSLESEQQIAVGVLSGSREDLKAVAQYQRGVVGCVAVYLILLVAQFALPVDTRWVLGWCLFRSSS